MSENKETSVLELGKNERYEVGSLTHEAMRLIGESLPRLTFQEGELTGFLCLRSHLGRLQFAGATVTGAVIGDTQLGEAEWHGVTFRHCQFKKVKIAVLSLRQVTFQNCTFEDVSFTTAMEPSSVDGVSFVNCYFHDAEEKILPYLKTKEWEFKDCVIAAPREIAGDNDNTYLPLLSFTPAAAPVSQLVPEMRPAATTTSPVAPKPEAPKAKETPKGGSRFDQLEIA